MDPSPFGLSSSKPPDLRELPFDRRAGLTERHQGAGRVFRLLAFFGGNRSICADGADFRSPTELAALSVAFVRRELKLFGPAGLPAAFAVQCQHLAVVFEDGRAVGDADQ